MTQRFRDGLKAQREAWAAEVRLQWEMKMQSQVNKKMQDLLLQQRAMSELQEREYARLPEIADNTEEFYERRRNMSPAQRQVERERAALGPDVRPKR